MRWASVARLYRRRLRVRLGQELFSAIGVAVGVALLFAVQVSNTSLARSVGDLTSAFVGNAQMQLTARDTAGFDERIADVAAASREVEAAAPLLQAQANVLGPGGERPVTLLASDERAAGLGGSLVGGVGLGLLPGLRAIVLPAGLAQAIGVRAGDSVRLQVAGRTVRAPVAATLDQTAAGTLADAPVVLAPLVFAQTLTGMQGRVSRVYVRVRPGREAAARRLLVALAAGRLDVRPADFDEQVFAQAAAPNDQSSGMFAQVTALVGFLFAFNAMLLMARDRRRVIAAMRLAGHSARTVRRLLTLDALVLGTVASMAGLLLGVVLSRYVFPPKPGYLSIAFPVGTARTISLGVVLLAFTAGMLATFAGTFAPLLARRVDPVADDGAEADDGRHPLRPHWRLLALAAVALGATAGVWMLAPTVATAGIVLLLVAMLLCLPAALSLLLALIARATHNRRTPVAVLAVGELRANGSRSITIVAVAAIAVFASGAIEGSRHDLQAGLDTVTHDVSTTTDVWITPASTANQLGVIPFTPAVRSAIARLPHVEGVDVYRGELLTIGTRRMWVFAPPTASRQLVPPRQFLDGDPEAANRLVRDHGQAAVSHAFAQEHDLHIGSRYTISAPHPISVRVAAIITNAGWPPGAIVINTRRFDTGWGAGPASALQVRLDAETSPEQGRALIADALAHTRWTGFTTETAAQREHHQRGASRDGLVRLGQISRLVLLTAALAMAISIAAMILERRRGIAALHLHGIRRSHLHAALLAETLILLTAGCLTGATYALAGTQLLDRWLTTMTGFPVQRTTGATAALTCLAAVVLIALIATLLPIRRAANAPAQAAFQD